MGPGRSGHLAWPEPVSTRPDSPSGNPRHGLCAAEKPREAQSASPHARESLWLYVPSLSNKHTLLCLN